MDIRILKVPLRDDVVDAVFTLGRHESIVLPFPIEALTSHAQKLMARRIEQDNRSSGRWGRKDRLIWAKNF
jgi:hypothetical protein